MKKILHLECTYCGYTYEKEFFYGGTAEFERCAKCKDRHLIIRDKKEVKIDTYAGATPFPEELIVLEELALDDQLSSDPY